MEAKIGNRKRFSSLDCDSYYVSFLSPVQYSLAPGGLKGEQVLSAEEVAKLIEAVDEKATEAVSSALEAGVDPVCLLKDGVVEGLRLIGVKFEEEEYFLAELMMGGKIAEKCIELIDPHIPENSIAARGVVVIGAVEGDLHDLGYCLVAKQLELAGFEVHQMGVNVSPMTFIDKAQEVGADIIGLSAFLVTTVPSCRDVIDYIRDMGLSDHLKVIIGGTATSQERADEIGAQGWAANAVEAVSLCEHLTKVEQAATQTL
jgi:5-methyltetrahydrofolate--homocysteine methyltransferase